MGVGLRQGEEEASTRYCWIWILTILCIVRNRANQEYGKRKSLRNDRVALASSQIGEGSAICKACLMFVCISR